MKKFAFFFENCLEVINLKTDDKNAVHFYDVFFNEPNQNDARQKMIAYAKNPTIEYPETFTSSGNYFEEFYPGYFFLFVHKGIDSFMYFR